MTSLALKPKFYFTFLTSIYAYITNSNEIATTCLGLMFPCKC